MQSSCLQTGLYMSKIDYAQIDWNPKASPRSRAFSDVYFSNTDALGETHYVFLEQNQLAPRFAQMQPEQSFCIGETGFGTGLNFFSTWQLFLEKAPATARLHYVSVEKHPLCAADLKRALAVWPQFSEAIREFLAQYFLLLPGTHRIYCAHGRIVLTLLIGDVVTRLSELSATVDAWFLDGFAPSKNPEMWSPTVCSVLARLSQAGTSFATFTAAGVVRRNLIAAGFTVIKVPGFGHKREMLSGFLPKAQGTAPTPWFARAHLRATNQHVVVIGGGLAGCCTAASFAQRGWRVDLLERHDLLASEASGNRQAVLYLNPSPHPTLLSRFILAGFCYTRRLLTQYADSSFWNTCGMLQLERTPEESDRQRALAEVFPKELLYQVDQVTAEKIAGIALTSGGLYVPEAGWVQPAALCHALVHQAQITVKTHHNALNIHKLPNGLWQVLEQEHLLAEAPVVVLANSVQIQQFSQTAALPVKSIRGQTTTLRATKASTALKTVLCTEGYMAPVWQGMHTLGASFNLHRQDLALCPEEQAANLAMLRRQAPELSATLIPLNEELPLSGHAALRCTTPDYFPLVGPVADWALFQNQYAALQYNARRTFETTCPWLEGLYINSAHGARGLISAPLAAALLVAWVTNEPLPMATDLAQACHPNRFLVRALQRRRPP